MGWDLNTDTDKETHNDFAKGVYIITNIKRICLREGPLKTALYPPKGDTSIPPPLFKIISILAKFTLITLGIYFRVSLLLTV